jgi:hypothetical protein
MDIIISLPGISFSAAPSVLDGLEDFLEIGSFQPTIRNLDVYAFELKDMKQRNLWGVNIPHWPLDTTMTNGLAGPGMPLDELVVPQSLEDEILPLIGKYDKWRPYPANGADDSYAKKLAKRFSVKRGKVFEFIVRWMKWDTIIYVDHSTACLAAVDMDGASSIANGIIAKAMRGIRHRPLSTCIIFSPYGPSSEPGFVVSNKLDVSKIGDWDGIRKYLNEEEAIEKKAE